MSDKADKRKPALEKIARIMGTTSFRTMFGSGGSESDPDIVWKGALGFVQKNGGDLVTIALEMFYSGDIQYEARLRHMWLATLKIQDEAGYDQHAFLRIGCALAIRQFAGKHKYSRGEIAEWAWLLRVRRDRLDHYVGDVTSWLNDALAEGERLFRDQMRDQPILRGQPNGSTIAPSIAATA